MGIFMLKAEIDENTAYSNGVEQVIEKGRIEGEHQEKLQ